MPASSKTLAKHKAVKVVPEDVKKSEICSLLRYLALIEKGEVRG